MLNLEFKPLHINVDHGDLLGNNGAGRYIFLPGSDSRAKQISMHFHDLTIKESSRGHNLYLGKITRGEVTIDVCSISTGMGTPSADIVINELLKLGAKKILRVGTCGLLQPIFMTAGDIAVAISSIKDEDTTGCYVPKEFPATASIEMINAVIGASRGAKSRQLHYGVFHTKSSLYAREFKQGAMKKQNTEYMDIIKSAGAIASEMESSILFTLGALADHEYKLSGKVSFNDRVIFGAICGVLGENDDFGSKDFNENLIDDLIALSISTFFELNGKSK